MKGRTVQRLMKAESKFTNELLAKIVEEVKHRLINNKEREEKSSGLINSHDVLFHCTIEFNKILQSIIFVVLKAGKEQEHLMTENHKLTSSLNHGEQTIFIRTEKYFRFLTSNYPVTGIDSNEIRSKSTNDNEVLTAFNCIRESSFNVTRGGGGGEDIEGRLQKRLHTRSGALKNCWARRGVLRFLLPKGGGAPKKLNH